MLQASLSWRFVFSASSFFQNCVSSAKVNIGRRKIIKAFVIALMVVMLNKLANIVLKIARQIMIIEQDLVFERLMPLLDLSLGLRMIRLTTHMVHAFTLQDVGQIIRHV